MIIPFFPRKIKKFIEPFAGLGRITELVKADEYYLNDKSDYAYNYLKNKFPNYIVENIDYVFSKDNMEKLNRIWKKYKQ